MTNKISILIPVYNEETTVIPLLQSVRQETKKIKDVAFEIIVIDDCSQDDSNKRLRENKPLYDSLISLEKNQGKGGAVLHGLKIAKGDYILFQDADLEYSPKDYRTLIRPVIEFDADVVMGSRFVAPEFTRVYYFWHKIGNIGLTLFFNILNNTTFTDTYSCYLMYRRELVPVEKIITKGWEQHGEILSIAVKNGEIFYEVPISYRGRSYKEGKKIRSFHIFKILFTIFRIRCFTL
ncbi:MAG: glycosyltransferase family 2 protein [Candidatus Electrothrix gigas]